MVGLAALAATGVALGAGGTAWAAAPDEGVIRGAAASAVPNSYIVVLKDSAIRAQSVDATVNALTSKFGGKVGYRYRSALNGYSVKEMSETQAKRLAADPAVSYVQRSTILKKQDTQYGAPWNLDRIDARQRSYDGAYQYPNTATNVHAYVVDTGIRITHNEFGGRASYGYDFIDNDSVADDCVGHGTHVAATLGGSGYGVAKGVQLVAVRVLDCFGTGEDYQVLAGIDWVVAHAVKPAVMNMSLGGGFNDALNAAVQRAVASGITVSVAAGNGDEFGNPVNACAVSPASAPDVLTVSATDGNDVRPTWANYGTCVDLFAPGVDVTSAFNRSDFDYALISGTSMATPHVAGAAALILGAHPNYTPAQVRDAILVHSTGTVVQYAGTGSPNSFLYVRYVEPPTIASKVSALYNGRFGTSEVYARTAENHIAYSYWTGRWSEWVDLGGDMVGDPAVLYNPRFGSTEVYARTSNNHIAYRYYLNGWSGWIDLGGNAGGDPNLLYNPQTGSTEIYVRTADNKLAYVYYSNGWSSWIDLQGSLAGDPTPLYNSLSGTAEVYVRTTGNELQYRYNLGGWSAWLSLAGNVASDPATLFNPRFNSTEVYVRTGDNKLAYRYYSGGWSAWLDLQGSVASAPALVYNPRFGTTEVYVRTTGNEVQYRYYANGWSGWLNLGGNVAGDPSLILNSNSTFTEVHFRTPDNLAAYRYYNGAAWVGWTYLSA